MSHNSKYYNKKIKLKHAVGTPDIRSSFGKIQNSKDTSAKQSHDSETASDPRMSKKSNTSEAEGPQNDTPKSKGLQSTEVIEPSDPPVPVVSSLSKSKATCMIGPVPPPSPMSKSKTKRKQSLSGPDQRKFSNMKYESLYSSWLYYSGVKRGYLCKTCELFGNQSTGAKAFVTRGVTLGTHPTRQLELHLSSVSHNNANKRLILARSNVNVYRQLLLTEDNVRMKNREALKKVFLCMDFLIQKKLAYTENTKALVEFVAKLGVKDLQEHLNSKSSFKYLSTTCVNEMLLCMSDLFERELLADLRGKEFSLLADESSDVAHRSQMSVMARFERNSAVSTHFLGFVELTKGTAEHIASALEGILVAKGVDIQNMRFCGFDGCNTMSGIQTGVQRRMSHVSPFSTYVNCRNHRLALCLTHLIKRFPVLQDVDSALLSLWKLFEFSPQKFSVFKHIQVVYGVEPLAFTKACTTRWLSHLQAAARFVSRYVCILDTLDSLYTARREPELMGIRLSLTNETTVATIVLLTDILKPVNMLSLYLQEENINFTTLPEHVKNTTEELHGLVEKYRRLETSDTEFTKCTALFDEIHDRTNLERRMRERDRQQAITPESYLQNTGIPLIYDLVQEIEDAFATGHPVLTGFGFMNPSNLPDTITDLAMYGGDSLGKLVNFYGSPKEDHFQGHVCRAPALMDANQLESELQSFRTQLFMLRRNGKTTVAAVYKEFQRDPVLQECFPLVYRLLYFSVILPSSTAVVERSFSLMSNILTKKRNRLTQRSLDAVMRLCHQRNELNNEQLERLVDSFKGMKNRKMKL